MIVSNMVMVVLRERERGVGGRHSSGWLNTETKNVKMGSQATRRDTATQVCGEAAR